MGLLVGVNNGGTQQGTILEWKTAENAVNALYTRRLRGYIRIQIRLSRRRMGSQDYVWQVESKASLSLAFDCITLPAEASARTRRGFRRGSSAGGRRRGRGSRTPAARRSAARCIGSP